MEAAVVQMGGDGHWGGGRVSRRATVVSLWAGMNIPCGGGGGGRDTLNGVQAQ